MEIRRHIMGLLGIVFLLAWVGLISAGWVNDNNGKMAAGTCLKVGSVLVAIWLAFPQVVGVAKRFPPWLMATIAVTGLVVAARPRMIIYLGPIVAAIAVLQFVGWLFKPLPKQRTKKK